MTLTVTMGIVHVHRSHALKLWYSSNTLMSGSLLSRRNVFAYADKCKVQASLVSLETNVKATSWPGRAVTSCRDSSWGMNATDSGWGAHVRALDFYNCC